MDVILYLGRMVLTGLVLNYIALLELNKKTSELNTKKMFGLALIASIAVAITFFLHELGHAGAAYLLDVEVTGYGTAWYGIYTTFNPIPEFLPPAKLFVIAISGSLVNLPIALWCDHYLVRTKNPTSGLLIFIVFVSNVYSAINMLMLIGDGRAVAKSLTALLSVDIANVARVQLILLVTVFWLGIPRTKQHIDRIIMLARRIKRQV